MLTPEGGVHAFGTVTFQLCGISRIGRFFTLPRSFRVNYPSVVFGHQS